MLGPCATLRDLLAADASGQRNCIPVFGTGLNMQAATLAGHALHDDWRALLVDVSRRVLPEPMSIDDLPRDHLALWESLLRLWAKKTRTYPFQAENELQRLICEGLRAREVDSVSFDLYGRIVDARFRDMLSLNFDRRLALSRGARFVAAPTPCPFGRHGESLFRHGLVTRADASSTRIWFPHGDVKKADTLKFGVRKYGFYIGVLREFVYAQDGAWRYRQGSLNRVPQPGEKAARLQDAPSWVPAFLQRPLVFVGCGLSPQEWPLWWLLRQRERAGSPPAVCLALSAGGVPAHLRGVPGVQTIVFDTAASLWSTFLACLSVDVAETEGARP